MESDYDAARQLLCDLSSALRAMPTDYSLGLELKIRSIDTSAIRDPGIRARVVEKSKRALQAVLADDKDWSSFPVSDDAVEIEIEIRFLSQTPGSPTVSWRYSINGSVR